MFYLSGYLEAHRDEYVERLRVLGREPGTWNHWIIFFLRALHEQAQVNSDKARAVIDLYARLKERVIALTHSQYAVPLLDKMFERPLFYSTAVKISGDRLPGRQSMAHLLRMLRDDGILTVLVESSGRRAQLLAFAELLNLCEGNEVF